MLTHAAQAADDEVVLQLREAPFHSLPPEQVLELALQDRARDLGPRVEHGEDGGGYKRHPPHPLMYIPENKGANEPAHHFEDNEIGIADH